jgi:hypothetical protein
VAINSQSQQDAFTDRELVGFSVTTSNPACNSFVVGTAPTDFVINLSDPALPSSVQASDFTVNGTAANSFTLSNSNATITFHFTSSPATQGQNTMHIPAGAILRNSDSMPIFEFMCSFRFGTTQLMVTTTNPPVGGTFTGPGDDPYVVNFSQPVDPTSVQTGDLMVSGTVSATVTNVTVAPDNLSATFTLHFSSIFGGTLTLSIPAGALADQFGNPNAAFSGDYNYTGSFCDSGIIQNGGFETGSFPPWVVDSSNGPPLVTNTLSHSGTFSGVAGGATGGSPICGSGSEPTGDSSFYQQFTVPAGTSTLSFYHNDCTTDSITFDWQDAYITNGSGTILQTIYHVCDSTNGWVNQQVDMTPYAGQTVRIKFLTHQDGFGDLTAQYIDDVALFTPCGTPTPTPTASPTPTPTPTASPTTTPTPTPTATPTCMSGQYAISTGTATIVPGTTDTGNHIDDGDTLVTLPFQFMLYGQTYTSVNVNSNGRLDFVCVNEPVGYQTHCLPPNPNQCSYDFTIFGLWEDMRTDIGLAGCSTWTNGCGIFTSVSGSAPNRIFNIEWHAVLFGNNASPVNFEVRLYENSPDERFDVIYGSITPTGATQMWVGGVQGNSGAGFLTQDFCLAAGNQPPQNVSRTYTLQSCGTPSPTPTATATATATATPTATAPATATPTATATATATATPNVTPRATPTPRPRPTPAPHP